MSEREDKVIMIIIIFFKKKVESSMSQDGQKVLGQTREEEAKCDDTECPEGKTSSANQEITGWSFKEGQTSDHHKLT